MSVVVKIENLSKLYRLGEINRGALYEDMQRLVAKWRGREKTTHQLAQDGSVMEKERKGHMWALKDINLEIKDGDLVGIIGRNGAGKSTLLKILSRITAPTHGRAEIHGRLASLLEVGTGFHPELTGRENVFLNGSILGMKTTEIKRRFDEIVDFSGVEDFLDTPVKRYSSGMRVRLAFAVAAHLDPDILIVDEVLAVGDAAFQQKCIGKIGSSAREGRTILFVSHNAAAVENLCRRGIVLENGRQTFDGTQTEALNYYAERLANLVVPLDQRTDHKGNGDIVINRMEFRNAAGKPVTTVGAGQAVEVWCHFQRHRSRDCSGLNLQLWFKTSFETSVFVQNTQFSALSLDELGTSGVLVCSIPELPLPVSSYRVSYSLRANMNYLVFDALDSAAELHVDGGDFFGTGSLPPIHHGVALVRAHWRIEKEAAPAQ